MNRCKVVSSNIDSIGFEHGILQVKFKNGSIYEYHDVTLNQFVALKNAPSVGKHLISMGIEGKKVGGTV